MATSRSVLIILSTFLAVVNICAAISLRGVDPALKAAYVSSDEIFKCLDGTKTIPISQVNDGYCDCYDGSDEPGTAGCPNGKFYCRNIGSMPVRLNASFVDDSVCDCCDGSDEQPGSCPNRCKEAGAAALAALEEDLKAFESGLRARGRYVKAAAGLRLSWDARLKEVEQLQPSAEIKAKGAKESETKLRKQLEALESKKSKLEEALKPPPSPPAKPESQPGVGDVDAQSGDKTAPASDAVGDEEKTESSEELAKRIASQWIPGAGDKDKGTKGEDAEGAKEEIDRPLDGTAYDEDEEDAFYEAPEDLEEEGLEEEEEEEADAIAAPADSSTPVVATEQDVQEVAISLGPVASIKAFAAGAFARIRGKPVDHVELEKLRSAVEAMRRQTTTAQKAANTARTTANELESERLKLIDQLSKSYGPDDVYAQLSDRCIDAHVDKYTYKVCPFSKAEQIENGASTNLGKWQGFDESGDHMKFEQGTTCWQGPPRSITVRVRCGTTETLSKVSEPSRCEYLAEMTTPAACKEEEVAAMRAALEEKRALLNADPPKDEL